MSNAYRMERIQRLLDELRYEVERGMMEGEVDESLGLVFFVPISKSLPNGVVRCEFRTRPIPRHMMGFGEAPRLKVITGKSQP